MTEEKGNGIGIETRILSIEKDVGWLKNAFEKQVLNVSDIAELTGFSKGTLYSSKQYLLPLNHVDGVTFWTRAEVIAHLNRPMSEIKKEYDNYVTEHRDELTARGREKSLNNTRRGRKKKSAS